MAGRKLITGSACLLFGLMGEFTSINNAVSWMGTFAQTWVLTAVLLSVHLAAFAAILTHVSEWRLSWFIGTAVEYPVFLFLRDKLVKPR